MFVLKNNNFKIILFLAVFIFLFLTIGAEFFHNHSDSEFHNDCPACIWLINLIFILSLFLLLPGLFLCFWLKKCPNNESLDYAIKTFMRIIFKSIYVYNQEIVKVEINQPWKLCYEEGLKWVKKGKNRRKSRKNSKRMCSPFAYFRMTVRFSTVRYY